MNRRKLFIVTLTLSILAGPLAADAQSPVKTARIGYLWPGSPLSRNSPGLEAFRGGLRDLGWVEGENIVVEYRWAEGRSERVADLAADLIQLKVDVIVAFRDLAARAVQQRIPTIPIVAMTDDLLGAGLVASLARPGGNTTGLTIIAPELSGKRLEVVKEVLPKVSRVVALWDPGTGSSQGD